MKPIEQMDAYGHEMLVYGRDEATGLRCIIAVHNTTLGPAVGGTRFLDYANEDDALKDVLRLSQGMSLKNAAAGLKLGGGKAVVLGDPRKLKSREFFHAYGRIIETLGGRYYTAEDVNTNTEDITCINEVTRYVTGTPAKSGNPAPFTARGVWQGMKAGAKVCFGSDSLAGLRVVVQGLGSVGYLLCRLLHEEGAKLQVYDINKEAMERAGQEFGAAALAPDALLSTECDVFAPCALGAVLNTENAKTLGCRLVCGSANNVLADRETGWLLHERGILYLPDYVVNAGGIINCGAEVGGSYNETVAYEQVDGIYNTTLKIIDLARNEEIATCEAADRYASGIIEAAKGAGK